MSVSELNPCGRLIWKKNLLFLRYLREKIAEEQKKLIIFAFLKDN